uniref:Uncharacterized protein n=1 Tax=Anguilla anguilla TaxID=7936 RepID=A0A0E9UN99_ANGAN
MMRERPALCRPLYQPEIKCHLNLARITAAKISFWGKNGIAFLL